MADNHGAAEPHVVPPLESSLPPPNDKLVTEESPVEIPATTSNPAMSPSGEVGSATQPPEVVEQKQSGLTAASKKRKRRIRYKRNKRTLPRTGDDGTRSTSKSRELTAESTPGVTTTDENKDDERDDDEETTSSELENSCPTVTWDSNAETIAVLSEIEHIPEEESCHSTTSDPAIVQVDADIPSSLSGHYPDFSNGTGTPHCNEEDVELAGTVSGSRHHPIEVVVEVLIPAVQQQTKTEITQITLGEEITFPISTSNEDEDSLNNNSGSPGIEPTEIEDNNSHFLCTEQPSASSLIISNADITTHEEMIPRNATPSQEELAYNASATTTTTERHAGDDDGKISASKPVESVTESTFGGATTKDNKADDRDDGEETTFSQPENSFPTMPWDSLKFSAETIAVMNEIDQMLDEEESHHSTASDHVLVQVDADVVSSLSGHYPDFSSGTDWTSHSNDEDVEWVGTVNSLHRPIEVVVVDQIPALQEQQEIECAMQEQDDDQETETAGRNTCLRNEAFGSVSAIFDTTAEQQDQDNFEIMEHHREQGEDNLLFNLSRAIRMSYPRTTRVTLGEEVSISTLNDDEDSSKPKSSAIEPTPAENNNPRFDIAEQPLPSSLIGNDDATNLDVITPSKEELESISSATIASTISVCHPEQLKELSPQSNIVALSEGDHDDQYLVSESESEFGGCCAALRRGRSRPWNKKDATNTGEGSSSRPGSMGGKRISFKERSASLKMRLSKVFFKGGPPTKE